METRLMGGKKNRKIHPFLVSQRPHTKSTKVQSTQREGKGVLFID